MRRVKHSEEAFAGGVLTITRFRNGQEVWRSKPMPNKVVSSSGHGRNLITRALANDATFPPAITTAKLGTGTNTPTDGDTDLQTPTVSGLSLTNAVANNSQLTVDVFVAAGTLPNGTYREFGLFCGARLFARILFSAAYTKATGEDTLFSYTLNITG